LACPLAAGAQQPFVVDDVEVTAPGIWHVELSNQLDLLRPAARPVRWQTAFDAELNVGVAPRIELAVLVPVIGLVSDAASQPLTAGVGDASLGAKMRFTASADARHAFAGSLTLELPTGDRDRELGSGLVDYGLNVMSQHRIDARWTARFNGGVVLAGNTLTGAVGIKERGTIITGGGSLVAQAAPRVQLGAEVTMAWSQKATLSGSSVGVQFGGNIAVGQRATLDVGVGTGWTDASPNVGFQAGLSFDLNQR
jgi:hypothetical protein